MRVSLLLYKRVRLPEEQFPPRDAAPPEAIFFRISKETAMSRCTQVAGFGVFLFVLGTILLMFASAERNSLIYWLGGPALFSAGFVMAGVAVLWQYCYRASAHGSRTK
ncbi:MAG: hypothetical protein DMG83_14465 [Acidobacteria bacterium]|nr:MAG: hypothetical protein DMG83_14465 [Acidobacteriota bacterium]